MFYVKIYQTPDHIKVEYWYNTDLRIHKLFDKDMGISKYALLESIQNWIN